MGGVIGSGAGYQRNALSGFSRASKNEQEVEQANDQLQTAEKQQKASMAVGGAAAGALIGAEAGSWGGPIGAVIGAGIGYGLSELF